MATVPGDLHSVLNSGLQVEPIWARYPYCQVINSGKGNVCHMQNLHKKEVGTYIDDGFHTTNLDTSNLYGVVCTEKLEILLKMKGQNYVTGCFRLF